MKWGSNTWVGGGLVGLALGVAIFAPWIALTDPVMDANLMNAELPPSWEFRFGTDAQGRDIYSRVVLRRAHLAHRRYRRARSVNSLIGVTLGLTAGYWGGWWDDLVNGLTNLMLAIPSLVFALAIMAILGPGLISLLIALGSHQLVLFLSHRPRPGAVAQEPGLRAGRAHPGLRRPAHHVHAGPAEHPGAA